MISLLLAVITATADSNAPPSTLQVQPKGDAAITLNNPKDPLSDQLNRAANLLKEHQPSDALPILDAIISTEESGHCGENRIIFSARSAEESLFYLMQAAVQKKGAVALDETWSTAYFLKGFALVDLNRAGEAKPLF
jgi:hypothetical protein